MRESPGYGWGADCQGVCSPPSAEALSVLDPVEVPH